MSKNAAIPNTILTTLGVSGWVSGQALYLLPFHYQRVRKNIKMLVDNKAIRLNGVGKNKRYKLLSVGRKQLLDLNANRYLSDLLVPSDLLEGDFEREIAKGDTTAIMLMASYSVHAHDKPPLPATTTLQNPNSPDYWATLFRNMSHHKYRGWNVSDKSVYLKRSTPLSCYYTSAEIKGYVRSAHSPDNSLHKGINYSRVCGVLMTVDYIFRVLYSKEKSLELKNTGENKFNDYVKTMFRGYIPQNQNAILMIGDNEYITAMRLLLNSKSPDDAENNLYRRTRAKNLSVSNSGNPMFYLPICSEAITLLRIYQYPGWQNSFMTAAARKAFSKPEIFAKHGLYFCKANGEKCFMGVDLNLTAIAMLLDNIQLHVNEPVNIVCVAWQESFFRQVIANGCLFLSIYCLTNFLI